MCELVDALNIPQYSASKQLTVLRQAGIVDVEKRGLWGYYHLRSDRSTNVKLFEFLRTFLDDETFLDDKRNLKARLRLREEGKCVVGFVPRHAVSQRNRRRLA